jgi:hypothetical protein
MNRHLGFVFVVECWPDEVVGLGAAKVVGCRKGFTVATATGGAEDEVEVGAEDERSCCLLSSTVIGTLSTSTSSLRNGGERFISYGIIVRRL